jgi:hypothetical protein
MFKLAQLNARLADHGWARFACGSYNWSADALAIASKLKKSRFLTGDRNKHNCWRRRWGSAFNRPLG